MSIIHLINKCIMGSGVSVSKVNYEDMQGAYKTENCNYHVASHSRLLINTLPPGMQGCLIPGTMPIDEEEVAINTMLSSPDGKNREIIVYGKNANDDTVYKKYQQLMGLGFRNVCVYPGGMFEWLLLQDIYGAASFPTTSNERDLLKYKPPKRNNGYKLILN
jgi:rhodanese-related sulfurtransferase